MSSIERPGGEAQNYPIKENIFINSDGEEIVQKNDISNNALDQSQKSEKTETRKVKLPLWKKVVAAVVFGALIAATTAAVVALGMLCPPSAIAICLLVKACGLSAPIIGGSMFAIKEICKSDATETVKMTPAEAEKFDKEQEELERKQQKRIHPGVIYEETEEIDLDNERENSL